MSPVSLYGAFKALGAEQIHMLAYMHGGGVGGVHSGSSLTEMKMILVGKSPRWQLTIVGWEGSRFCMPHLSAGVSH